MIPPPNSSFTPTDWAILARHWYPILAEADLGPKPSPTRLLDERLVVYRADDRVVVARDLCIHRGVPLSLGHVEGEDLICRYHGLRFGPDGACSYIPSAPNTNPSPRLRLTTYPVQIRYGLIWTSLDPEADPARLPQFPLWDDPAYLQIIPPAVDIQGSAGRVTESFIDVAHFAFIHGETFADPQNPLVPTYAVHWNEDGTLTSDYISDVANTLRGAPTPTPIPEGFQWRRLYEIQLPFFPRLTIFYPAGLKLGIFNCPSPRSARETRLFVPIARNFDHDADLAAIHEFNLRVFDEDRVIVESQHPEDLPLDLTAEAHIPADRASIAYRQGLAKLGLGRTYTS